MDPVRKRFSPEDLQGELSESGIDGTVLVQTISSLDESRELLATVSRWEWVRGVAAWVDLAAGDVADQLDESAGSRWRAVGRGTPPGTRRGGPAIAVQGAGPSRPRRSRKARAHLRPIATGPGDPGGNRDGPGTPRALVRRRPHRQTPGRGRQRPAWEAGMPGLAALENVAQEVEPVRGRLEGAVKG
jgi:hypothetical protein